MYVYSVYIAEISIKARRNAPKFNKPKLGRTHSGVNGDLNPLMIIGLSRVRHSRKKKPLGSRLFHLLERKKKERGSVIGLKMNLFLWSINRRLGEIIYFFTLSTIYRNKFLKLSLVSLVFEQWRKRAIDGDVTQVVSSYQRVSIVKIPCILCLQFTYSYYNILLSFHENEKSNAYEVPKNLLMLWGHHEWREFPKF